MYQQELLILLESSCIINIIIYWLTSLLIINIPIDIILCYWKSQVVLHIAIYLDLGGEIQHGTATKVNVMLTQSTSVGDNEN